jgi:hypothetical protein
VLLSRRQILLGSVATSFVAGTARAEDDADAVPTGVQSTSIEKQARWLAGLEPLSSFEPSVEWRTYAKNEDERWQAAQARVGVMQTWAAKELAPLLLPEHTLVYPFGGPDVLHAMALFGGARRMLLVGLEPVGTLPDLSRPIPSGYFTRLAAANADLHKLTFFRTQEMQNDFQRDGVIATLVATIARMGGRVASVQTITTSANVTTSSARIEFLNAAGKTRRVDYVQADLANAGLKIHTSLTAMMHGLAPYVTFMKAAMYLPFEARFSSLRQLILDDSAVVVQDDTGVPFRFFVDAKWATRVFGKYETPVTPFEPHTQPDLKSALEKRAVGSVPFGFGYRIEARRSNLIIASKGQR